MEVVGVETMVTVDDDSGGRYDVWRFGDSDFGGGDIAADYPFLQRYEKMRPGAQAVAYATRQIRLRARGAEATPGEVFMLNVGGELALDTNGRAADQAPSPSCELIAGEVRAETNYNNVTVILRATNGAVLSLPDAANCGVGYPDDVSMLSILAIVSSGEAAETISYSFAVAVDPLVAARSEFVAAIAAGDFDWFSASRVVAGVGNSLDWDGDGVANPYDWTPTPDVNLTLDGSPDGSAGNPWPIYNVWQLQAIDGISVSGDGTTVTAKIERTESDGTTVTLDFAFFGDSESERLGAHYRLATHIDATPTRNWADGGFRPIGGANVGLNSQTDRFQGGLNGDGWEIRGLSVRAVGDFVGMFAGIGNSGVVASLLLSDLQVSGNSGVGAATGGLVGVSSGDILLVGGSGVVRNENTGGGANIGGLAGFVERGAVEESWFAGEVAGNPKSGSNMGGLIGLITGNTSRGENNWSQARLEDTDINNGFNGGLIGGVGTGSAIDDSWAGGEVVGDNMSYANSPRGLIGNDINTIKRSNGYSDRSTSGDLNPGGVAQVVETMVTLNEGLSLAVWEFGDVTVSDGAADYPFLKRYEVIRPGAQAVFYALQQTRLRLGGDELTVSRGGQFTLASGDVLRLDTNGSADEDNADDPTPKPSCELNSGEVRATTNYNGVTVFLRSDGNATFLLSGCDVDIRYGSDIDAFTLTIVVEAGEASATKSYSFVAGVFSELLPTELLLPPEAEMGEAVYTVAIGAGASLRAFSDVNDLSSGGGSPGILSLEMDATAVFATDNAFFSLTLTAALRGGGDETRAVRVQSAVRFIGQEPLDVDFYSADLTPGNYDLVLNGWGLSIWHDRSANLTISTAIQPSSYLFLISGQEIYLEATPPDVGNYTITLRVTEGDLKVERELRVNVLAGNRPIPFGIVVPEPQPLVVAADASAGVTILTVSTNGGTNPIFVAAANDNLEASGGGDMALVSLTEDASLAFASDNLTLSLPLTANADDSKSATATIRFVSAPLAINQAPLKKKFDASAVGVGAEILAVGDSELAIWHFDDGNETYTLAAGADSAAFELRNNAKGNTDEVVVAGDALAASGIYNFELQLSGGEGDDKVIAKRSVQVSVRAAPVAVGPSQESLDAAAAFVAEIADDDFDWFADRAGAVSSLDWDGDTTLNVYDWTPLPGVTLTLGGAVGGVNGSANKPWPLYNVWQLQAIDGVRVDVANESKGEDFTLFGANASVRLESHYRLAVDIDATPTKKWDDGQGFSPIAGTVPGGRSGDTDPFVGGFDGDGHVVRGLFINRVANPM